MVARGEIWWIDFGEPYGSEPGGSGRAERREDYRRPALVVSSDRFNASRISTVIVTAVTSNLRLAAAPGNVELAGGAAGLPKASVVNVWQTLVVDRSRLADPAGSLDIETLRRVDDGLRLVLGL